MSYFLSSQNLQIGKNVELDGEESRHILLSRRMKVGELVVIQGVDGKRFKTEIKEVGKNILKLTVHEQIPIPAELLISITLFQSVVSEKALDFIFQKSTELGAAGITLFNSQNTAVRLSVQQFAAKLPRWKKILWEAAKQSDRGTVPELKFLPDLDSIIKTLESFNQTFICDASGSRLHVKGQMSGVTLLVGPEGGFTPIELTQLKKIKNSTTISLSPFTLRAETAAIGGLAIIQSII